METRKLYYEDCHKDRFTAQVVGCAATEKGYLVTLDATAFYPEGGGQACDLGNLGEARVLDVQELGEEVYHLCDRPLAVGSTVEGRVDYARRFDLMQQHTGEHMVSGVIHARYGYHNVGFHMGADVVTIDFDGPIPPEALPGIEAEVNEAVWKDLPLRIWYPSPEALPETVYRSKRALPWPVRIVEVPGMDRCACCGIHVERTGEVGLVKLFSCVKFHQGVRMEMACGRRALALLNTAYTQNRLVSQEFSAKLMETGAAARRMTEALAQEKLRCGQLRKQIFDTIARDCRDWGNILRFEPDLEPAQIRMLADAMAETCGGTAAVFSGSDQGGYSYSLVTRRGDLRSLGKEMTQALSGRGGGRDVFQQGSLRAAKAEIQEFFQSFWEAERP